MFGNLPQLFSAWKKFQQLSPEGQEALKTLMAHPKFQELFKDPKFLEGLKSARSSHDAAWLFANPKLSALMQDPEVAQLLAKVDFRMLLQA